MLPFDMDISNGIVTGSLAEIYFAKTGIKCQSRLPPTHVRDTEDNTRLPKLNAKQLDILALDIESRG